MDEDCVVRELERGGIGGGLIAWVVVLVEFFLNKLADHEDPDPIDPE